MKKLIILALLLIAPVVWGDTAKEVCDGTSVVKQEMRKLTIRLLADQLSDTAEEERVRKVFMTLCYSFGQLETTIEYEFEAYVEGTESIEDEAIQEEIEALYEDVNALKGFCGLQDEVGEAVLTEFDVDEAQEGLNNVKVDVDNLAELACEEEDE